MTLYKKYLSYLSLSALCIVVSCEDRLNEINQNPNGISPENVNPYLLLPTIQSTLGKSYVSLGFGDVAGVVQHTQLDAWNGPHNNFEWEPRDWTQWYDILRNNTLMMQRAEALGYPFYQGAGLVIRAYVYGLLADLYGDVPYAASLQGFLGGNENLLPAFDAQEDVYMAAVQDLKQAASVLSEAEQNGVNPAYDIYYDGSSEQWRKFAHSLLLRYYMRLSSKMPDVAQAGIEEVYNSGVYFQDVEDGASMDFPGGSQEDSWPSAYDLDNGNTFRRIRMAQPLLDTLLNNNDPRLQVWLAPVHVQWVADPELPQAVDTFLRENGELMEGVAYMDDRTFAQQIARGNVYTRRYNPDSVSFNDAPYVGLPVQLSSPGVYNGNPRGTQSLENQHVSQLSDIYRQRSHELLKARLMSYAEVCFIFAEAALRGWAVGNTEAWYETGIKASLEAWGLGEAYEAYMAAPGVAFNGTLQQIMTQKWIAGWTAATEAWFDYRRTGLPDFQTGTAAARDVLPVRFVYGSDELNFNTANASAAIESLEETSYSGPQGKNSPWSKPWLLQGTANPW